MKFTVLALFLMISILFKDDALGDVSIKLFCTSRHLIAICLRWMTIFKQSSKGFKQFTQIPLFTREI